MSRRSRSVVLTELAGALSRHGTAGGMTRHLDTIRSTCAALEGEVYEPGSGLRGAEVSTSKSIFRLSLRTACRASLREMRMSLLVLC